MAWLFIFKSLLFSLLMLHVSAQDGGCPTSFSCGYLGNIAFPFTVTQHPHCGILAISGCDQKKKSAPKSIQLGKMPSKQSLIVTYVEGNTISVSDETQRKYLQSKKCQAFHNYAVPPTSPLGSFYIKFNITMFKCNHSLSVTPPESFQNYTNCSGYDIYYDLQNTVRPPLFKVPNSLAQCTQCQAAIRDMPTDDPFEFLSPQISIVVQLSDDCNQCLHHQGGRCQLDIQGKFHCDQGNRGWFVKMLILGVGVVVTAALLLIVVKIFYTQWRTRNPTNLVIEVFLKKHGPLQTKRYCYSEIKKVTDSFKHKLVQGGFGIIEIKPFTITIKDDQLHDLLLQKSCDILTYDSMFTVNTPLVSSRLEYYVTVFGCNSSNSLDLQQYCPVSNSTSICREDTTTLYGVSDSDIKSNKAIVVVTDSVSNSNHLKGCSNVELPTSSKVDRLDPADLFNVLSGEIAIKLQVSQNCSSCHDLYGGQCLLDNNGQFYCKQGKVPSQIYSKYYSLFLPQIQSRLQ